MPAEQKISVISQPPPQGLLPTLSAELLYSIFGYLDLKDISNLLFVCKSIYPIAHRELWSNLGFLESYSDEEDYCRSLPEKAFSKFLEIYDLKGSREFSPVWESTKTLGLCLRQMSDKRLVGMLIDAMKSGKLSPSHCIIEVYDGPIYHKFDKKIWRLLGAYSKSKTPKELSFSVSIQENPIPVLSRILGVIGINKLTDLSLDIELAEYGPEPETMIIELTEVLVSTVNLKRLTLAFDYGMDADNGMDVNSIYDISWIQISSGFLANLQRAFDGLHKLQQLRIHGGIFIHPSFFLTPPKSVKTLELQCLTTPDWWLKFAACPFENVEDLFLYYEPGGISWQDFQSEIFHGLDLGLDPHNAFKIKSVAITSLKSFSGRAPPYGPTDLLECILANNEGLQGNHNFMQNWADDVVPEVEECAQAMLESLADTIEQLKGEYTYKYMENNGVTGLEMASYLVRDCIRNLRHIIPEEYRGDDDYD